MINVSNTGSLAKVPIASLAALPPRGCGHPCNRPRPENARRAETSAARDAALLDEDAPHVVAERLSKREREEPQQQVEEDHEIHRLTTRRVAEAVTRLTEAIELHREHPSSERCQAVGLSSLARDIGLLAGFRDQLFGEQSLDHPVEISGIEDDETVGVLGDRLHEAVAMQVLIGEGKQQLQIDGLERQEMARVVGHRYG